MHDAEDLVQETMLRAWRARASYDEARASLRTWLYRIATNACLSALSSRSRRPLPTGLVGPSDDPAAPLSPGHEVPWLQPFPTGAAAGGPDDPVARLVARGRLRLALIAAMQLLPARQRAILILRDTLDWPAAQVADALGTSVAAVNSGLQRARARLGTAGVVEDELSEPADPSRRAVLDRYVAAFERADLDTLAALLADDVVMEMPPMLNWYLGAAHYRDFLARVFRLRGTDWQVLPTAANGQPAFAAYLRDGAGYRPHSLQVLTVAGGRVRHNVVFADTDLFGPFGLPDRLDPR
ncbi:RNA polymerase sigma factor [Actinocatenispora thailandica]|uniref:RNA polymerase sigma factor n=2 Tax=Actinocatenispora thailandica TaxID=227318 RepID=A0A7R7DRH7_9ACTN|nr:RNA polymerase sigma factor [Actinocatenispora thailandica]